MAVRELPKGVVKLISSSQVISSISSVVKELVENSIDANATVIDIKLERNGLGKIEVRDNGCGISASDIYNVCLPHYTSKISCFDDLENLRSYGFRGEALNSLCAISQVSIMTKTLSDEVASTYTYDNNGTVREVQPSHQMKGTIVAVTDLFRNVPVRKQYYENTRKALEELKKIEKVVKLLSVIHPKLRVTIAHNKCLIWQKTSVNSLRLSLMQVYPHVVLKNLVDFSSSYGEMSLEMLICKRDCNWSVLCQPANEAILFFINQRPVKDKKVEKVVMEEMLHLFASTLPSNKCPLTLISIKLPPQNLDVNLEPDKSRVFMKNQEEVLKQIRESIMLHFYEQPLNSEKREAEPALPDITSEGIKRRKVANCDTNQNNRNKHQSEEIKDKSAYESHLLENDLLDLDASLFDENLDIRELDSTNVLSDYQKPNENITANECLTFENNLNSKHLPENTGELCFSGDISEDLFATQSKSDTEIHLNIEAETPTAEITANHVNQLDIVQKQVEILYSDDEVHSSEGSMDSLMKEINSNFKHSNENCSSVNSDKAAKSVSEVDEKPIECSANVNQRFSQSTLSQWSKGNINVENQRLQGGAYILAGTNKEINARIPKPEKGEKKQATKSNKRLTGVNAMERSVSSQMGRKDLAGLTNFARTVRTEILEKNPGISFSKVASELANRWRSLEDDQKNMYAEKAKSSKNQKKLSDVKARQLLRKKPILLNIRLEDIELLKNARRSSSEKNVRVINVLQSKNVWLCRIDDTVVALNVSCLQENVLFHRYLCHSSIPTRPLNEPIKIKAENLGNELLKFLLSLERSCSNDGTVYVISDFRIVKNGFKVTLLEESPEKYEIFITEMTNEPSFSAFENFIETLQLAKHYDDLLHCRPSKIKQILRDKVAETRRDVSNFTETDVIMLLQYWIHTMSQTPIYFPDHRVCVNLHNLCDD